jgi:hypothetical protein
LKKSTFKISKTRRAYAIKLAIRCILLLLLVALYFWKKEEFLIVEGWNFFRKFSVLHIMWVVWIFDMIVQLIPVRANISIGSQKQFLRLFRPSQREVHKAKLKKYIQDTTKSAYKVMIIWGIGNGVIYALYFTGIIDVSILFLITTFYYVSDLICVLIWCPFRLIMKNKCCTTCRIFNWDHLMMFTPFIITGGFFGKSLLLLSIVLLIQWEIAIRLHPERFSPSTNENISCKNCNEKLCVYYKITGNTVNNK